MTAATNAVQFRSGYNNFQIGYLVPDVDGDGINIANDPTYPAAGALIAKFDTVANAFVLANTRALAGRNAADAANIDIVSINSSDKLVTGSTLDLNWETFTPTTFVGTGSLTFGSVSLSNNFFFRLGDMAFIHCRANGTTGGVTSTELGFTLPAGLTAQATNLELGCSVFENSGYAFPGRCYATSGTTFRVHKLDLSNFFLGAGTGFIIQGALRLA